MNHREWLSASDWRAPSCFVRQFSEDHPTCDQLVFVDSFADGGLLPGAYGSWNAAGERRCQREEQTRSHSPLLEQSGNGLLECPPSPQEQWESSVTEGVEGTADHTVEKKCCVHEMYNSMRLAQSERRQRRVSLQKRAGQTVLDRYKSSEDGGPAGDDRARFTWKSLRPSVPGPTEKRLHQKALRDRLHVTWMERNADAILWHCAAREEQLQTTRTRRRERIELENYCGTLYSVTHHSPEGC